jgi:dynein heavy chain
MFDLETSTWSAIEGASGDAWGPRRWNHTAMPIFSVPHWKLFVFGGNTGDLNDSTQNPQGTFVNDMVVLDCGSNTWSRPETVGDKPPPMADTMMSYDIGSGKAFIFGGWSNQWHGELYTCKISDVAGPPYNITNISPIFGPITGKTETFISGQGFTSVKGAVVVRYACAKGFREESGTVVNDGLIKFPSPNFEKFGPVLSECRVAIGGKSLSTATVEFQYFSVTDATQTVCYGTGLTDGCIALAPVSFIIESRDQNGNQRKTGMDEFIVQIVDKGGLDDEDEFFAKMEAEKRAAETAEKEAAKAAKGKAKKGKGKPKKGEEPPLEEEEEEEEDPFANYDFEEQMAIDFEDLGNGKYLVTWVPSRPANYEVSVEFLGSFDGKPGVLRGSPFKVVTKHGDPEENSMTGDLMVSSLQKQTKKLKDDCLTYLKSLKSYDKIEDRDALIAVMETLNEVKSRNAEISLLVERSEACFEHLKEEKVPVTQMVKKLQEAEELWEEVLNQVPVTDKAIIPITNKMAEKTEYEMEKYCRKFKILEMDFRAKKMWSYETGPKGAMEDMAEAHKEVEAEKKTMHEMSHLCEIFGYPSAIDDAKEYMGMLDGYLESMERLWGVIDTFQSIYFRAKDVLWREIDLEQVENVAKKQCKIVKKCDENVKFCKAFQELDKQTKDYLTVAPLMQQLSEPYIRDRHWAQLKEVLGDAATGFVSPLDDPDVLFGNLLDLNMQDSMDACDEICDAAMKEAKMEKQLAELEERWGATGTAEFQCTFYQDTDIPLLIMLEDDVDLLENDQLTVQGMLASRFVAQFEEEVSAWQKALANVGDVMTYVTSEIQRTWAYLEPLFMKSAEVQRELPEDAARFKDIDSDVKDMLKAMWEAKNIKTACNLDGLLEKCEEIVDQLNICKRSLKEFLDGRRRQFPRYYFTSEADLLDILSNGSTPAKIMHHTPKVYLQSKTFVLSEGDDVDPETGRPYAIGWRANVGKEDVPFEPRVALVGKVEIYMQTLLDAQKLALFKCLQRSLVRYGELDRKDWVMHKNSEPDAMGIVGRPEDAAQIILLGLAINYVQEVEECFRDMGSGNPKAMEEYSKKQIDQLADLIKLTQSNITKPERQRVMACITMDAHSRDVILKTISSGFEDAGCFWWQSQLKHKYRKPPPGAPFMHANPELRGKMEERAEIAICDAILPYDYEYLGNGFRLVITPLTDRIYVTATQALNLKMGCAPAGPAGTGKTETTKDLANAAAKCVYVVNCSPEMDYKGLGNIFKGVASSGAWICFDEFNRLVPEVLSVCTVQFKSVCDGCKTESNECTIEGDAVFLNPSCGAFITMNPGYLGRSELPEGLKALFRPITVMVPDLVLICENFLMAEGFVEAKMLASKFYGLYSLLGALLSKQLHYDWGLRAVKSVLVVAGSFKRAEPDVTEEALLMRALRDFNIPKIVLEDEVIFFGLLGDLFPFCENKPRTVPPRKKDEELEHYVQEACIKIKNTPDEVFMLKVVQYSELLAIRHCVFLMGPAAAGKTQCWKTLQAARGLSGQKTMAYDVNPKSVTTKELYGYISMATREWKDGLLSSVMRSIGEIPDELPKWIMLDGDLDANWIESMNSVMDDNRMLTLASNERIPLKPHMRMVFEIRNLKYATPATVSRAGILYISSADGTQWRSLITAWLLARNTFTEDSPKEKPEEKENREMATAALREYFDLYVNAALFWMKVNVVASVPLQDMTYVQTLLFMLDGTLNEKTLVSPETIEKAFVYSAIWAFGMCLNLAEDGTDQRKLLSDWWRSEFKNVKFPPRETVFDYWLDVEEMNFEQWSKSPYFYEVDFDSSSTPMASVTVPTAETCSVAFWMQTLVDMKRPVMLAGPAGVGKTQMVLGMLHKLDPAKMTECTVNFNFYTDSAVLQDNLCLPLEKKTGINFGPPGNTKMIYFVDDLTLPEVDKYNTQSAIALMRQLIEYHHIFDLNKLSTNPRKNIADFQFVAALNPSAGSFEINPRLQRWFATFAIGLPSPSSLITIYHAFLQGHLTHGEFPEEIVEMGGNIIKAALGVHGAVANKFRKTAANFHYEFNIRHIANVFQGILVSQPEQFDTAEKFMHLWLHESERVYGDRLVTPEDLKAYNDIAMANVRRAFSFNVDKFYAGDNPVPLVFCHFAESISEQVYDQIDDITHMSDILTGALAEYNDSNAVMDLVLFNDAMKHVARISRIVLNEGGHALCVGVGGSGKQSLSRLAAFICNYTVKQIVISSTYSIADLKDDLKWMYNVAGVKGNGVMFLLTDSQIVNERFLIYINDLLATGNIPDLFQTDEEDAIVGSVAGKVKSLGLVPDKPNCWEFFLGQIRKYLHVVLCFSPVGDTFRSRARKFPAIVNSTVIDWFQPWPENALFAVGQKFMEEMELGDQTVRDGIEKFMPYSFIQVNQEAKRFLELERRFVYTTPKSFLELLKLYSELLHRKVAEAEVGIDRLFNGLQRLKETAESVVRIEFELKEKLEEAEIKKSSAEAIADNVMREKKNVEVESAKAAIEKEKVDKIQKEVSEFAAVCADDLAKAEPAVAKAMAALDTLDAKQIGECKGMNTAPAGVGEVFACTACIMAGIMPSIEHKNNKVKDMSWGAVKKQCLSNVKGYMDSLLHVKTVIDDMQFPAINAAEAKKLIATDGYDPEVIKTKNSAAAGLCSFTIFIIKYYDIMLTVDPKRKALAEANATLDAANAKLVAVEALVADLNAKLATLTVELNAADAEKAAAIDVAAKGQLKLELANRLTNALASENERWAVNIEVLQADKILLTGDVLLASAFISYCGPFTAPFRDKLMNKIFTPFLKEQFASAPKAPLSEEADPLIILTDEAEKAQWMTDHLPSDRISMQNGAIVCNSARWPLIIDPQLQGIKWLRYKEKHPDRHLEIVRLGQKDTLRKLTRALENGFTLIIENLGETMDAILNPVISRQTTKRGRTLFVTVGDAEVEMSRDFRLFLHTKLSNPHFPPEIQAETTLINFTVTRAGVEDQMLALVVRKQRKDLADLSEVLVAQQNGFKIKMKELEDSILHRLASAEGDITEDIDLIEGLENTKKISIDIGRKSEKALQTQQEIKVTSEKYRPVADRSALLFFLMNDLVKMHTYYIYSLAAFLRVFYRGINKCMAKVEGVEYVEHDEVEDDGPKEVNEHDMHANDLTDEQLAERCTLLLNEITETVYLYLERGLFVKDKLTVATLLTIKILVNDGLLEQASSEFLIQSKVAVDPGNMGALAEWLPDAVWSRVKGLGGYAKFKNLGDNMQGDSDDWQVWFDQPKPEDAKLPGDYQKVCNEFDRLIILRAMRPDRVTAALVTWIDHVMGKTYVTQPVFDMKACYSESSPQTPTFFVLFAGTDPTPWVEGLARELDITTENGRFCNISMGQGQEKPAESCVSKYAVEGGWVMLQNCHLMHESGWVPKLERLLEQVSEHAHPDFRCFISAEPPAVFNFKNMPESLMQSCIKVANEAPADIKSNMMRSWSRFNQEMIDGCTKPNELKGCLYALSWFHSIVLGRRRFGQQGWSRKYSFNTGDLEICAAVNVSYLDAVADATGPASVPWDDLRYLFGEIFYGGHITDAWDRRTANTYLEVLFSIAIFDQVELGPGFKNPKPDKLDYEGYNKYTEEVLPPEAPPLFGLHPNAEIGYLTNTCIATFKVRTFATTLLLYTTRCLLTLPPLWFFHVY